MKTNEIIAALRQCSANTADCRKCPAYNQSAGCLDLLHKEAADLIERLEKKLKSAVQDLGVASECWSCKRNSKCHPDMPVRGPDVCCGNYEWRGVTDINVGSKDERRWIPVTERLPLNDTYINVTTDGVVVPAYWHNDRFYAFTAIGVATVGGVTHWMPLPEPPKEETCQK